MQGDVEVGGPGFFYVHILVKIELPIGGDIHVGHKTHRAILYAIRQAELVSLEYVAEVECIGEGGLQGGVSALEGSGVGEDQPGCQAADAGPGDAARVRKIEALVLVHLLGDEQRREPRAVIAVDDGHRGRRVEACIGVFVAQPRLQVGGWAQLGGEARINPRHPLFEVGDGGVKRHGPPGLLPHPFVDLHVVFKAHRGKLDARFDAAFFAEGEGIIRFGHPNADGCGLIDPQGVA